MPTSLACANHFTPTHHPPQPMHAYGTKGKRASRTMLYEATEGRHVARRGSQQSTHQTKKILNRDEAWVRMGNSEEGDRICVLWLMKMTEHIIGQTVEKTTLSEFCRGTISDIVTPCPKSTQSIGLTSWLFSPCIRESTHGMNRMNGMGREEEGLE